MNRKIAIAVLSLCLLPIPFLTNSCAISVDDSNATRPQPTTFSLKKGQLEISGNGLAGVENLSLEQNGTEFPLSILSRSSSNITGAFAMGTILTAATSLLKMNTANAQATSPLTIDLSNVSASSLNVTGKIGVGTTTPTSSLHLLTVGSRILTLERAAANANVPIEFANGTTSIFAGLNSGNDFSIALTNNLSASPLFYVERLTGNVGIGTASPDQRLMVSNGVTVGRYTTSGWTHSSDARLKHDIKSIDHALEKILRLRGVEFKFNADKESRAQIGFVAQEVESIFPEVVREETSGFKSMAYANLVAPLVEAMKELNGNIGAVFGVSERHEREISRLRSEVVQLKTYICAKDPQAPVCQ